MCTLRFLGWLAVARAALGYLLDPVGTVGATARFTDEARAAYLSATSSKDAPPLPLIAALQPHGARVTGHDPVGMGNVSRLVPQASSPKTPMPARRARMRRCWSPTLVKFRHLDLDRLRSLLADAAVVDLRNLCHPAGMRKAGLIYVGVGRACPRRTAIVSEAAE